ncbi:hypothetical protein J437_LFUL015708, partial [Ladona fulva]
MKTINGKPEYTGAADVLIKVTRNEGFFALWKGFTPYYARLGPHTVLTFIFLEQMNSWYRKRLGIAIFKAIVLMRDILNTAHSDIIVHSTNSIPDPMTTIGFLEDANFFATAWVPLASCFNTSGSLPKCCRGSILKTSPVLVVTTILLPTASRTSTLSVRRVSHGRAVKAYGFE